MSQKNICHYCLVDEAHNTYQCDSCGNLETMEANTPYENGWSFCPSCGRPIATEEEIDSGRVVVMM